HRTRATHEPFSHGRGLHRALFLRKERNFHGRYFGVCLCSRSFIFSHFAYASVSRSLGSVSTGMLFSAQNLRHSTKRASYCPVSSEIEFGTTGFFFSATFRLPRSLH